jgi:hypothetical protein
MLRDIQMAKRYKLIAEEDPSLKIIMAKYKLKQVSEIFCEFLKLKDGLTEFTCQSRNLLQILSGEMELLCNEEINGEVKELTEILDTGDYVKNWKRVIRAILDIQVKIFTYCSQ